jgi:hypothetical protein
MSEILNLPSLDKLFRPECNEIQVKNEDQEYDKTYKNSVDYTVVDINLKNCPRMPCRGLASLEPTSDATGYVCNRCASFYDCPTYVPAFEESA